MRGDVRGNRRRGGRNLRRIDGPRLLVEDMRSGNLSTSLPLSATSTATTRSGRTSTRAVEMLT